VEAVEADVATAVGSEEDVVEETQDMVVMAGDVTEAMEVDEEAAVAMAVAVVVDVGDTETEGTGLEETVVMAADPTEGAREDTDRVAAMEAARAMAVDRVEATEATEKISLCTRKENNIVLKQTYFPTITILTFDVSTTKCLLAPLIS